MAITESEMNAIRELFLECAGSILASERKMLGEMLHGIEERLDGIDASINRLADYEELKGRITRLEGLTGFPVAK